MFEVVGVCREESVGKLADFEGRVNIVPGATDDREVIKRAVAGCDGVSACSSRGGYTVTRRERPRRSSTTRSRGHGWCSRAGGISLVMARTFIVAAQGAREGRRPSRASPVRRPRRPGGGVPAHVRQRRPLDRRAWQRLEEGDSQGLPVWSRHVGDPVSRATSRAAWTSPYSWWRPSSTMSLFTRPPRSSAARVLRRSRRGRLSPPLPLIRDRRLHASNLSGRPSDCRFRLLLCQEIVGVSVWSGMGAGVWSSCQMRRVRWRLRQRMASLVLLPSVRLRAM